MNTQLLEWYNLIFELPLGLGLMYLALYCVSGWTFGDADSDAGGFDHDMDAHLDANGEISAEADLDHDADLSQDAHIDSGADSDSNTDSDSSTETEASESDAHASPASAFLSALNWIGIGRMPLSLVLMILMLCWGSIGFAATQMQHGKNVETATAVSVAIAAAGSLFITHFVSSILGKTLFANLNIARRRHELLGSMAEALYPIDGKFGMVTGRDDRGELFQVACRIEQGQESIAKGAPVQLVAYTAKERMFYVVPAESSVTPRRLQGNKA